jgi:hypothetical protein
MVLRRNGSTGIAIAKFDNSLICLRLGCAGGGSRERKVDPPRHFFCGGGDIVGVLWANDNIFSGSERHDGDTAGITTGELGDTPRRDGAARPQINERWAA